MLEEAKAAGLPAEVLAPLLGISVGSHYYKPRPPSEESLRIERFVVDFHHQQPASGMRGKAHQVRRQTGMTCGLDRVRTIVKDRHLVSLSPGPTCHSKASPHRAPAPNLIADLADLSPNQVWT